MFPRPQWIPISLMRSLIRRVVLQLYNRYPLWCASGNTINLYAMISTRHGNVFCINSPLLRTLYMVIDVGLFKMGISAVAIFCLHGEKTAKKKVEYKHTYIKEDIWMVQLIRNSIVKSLELRPLWANPSIQNKDRTCSCVIGVIVGLRSLRS